MGNRKQIPSRQYTDEYKVEAVRLAEAIGGNQAAKRLGIPDSSVWNWLRLSRAGKLKSMHSVGGQVKPGVKDLEAENERLRRELANAKMDLEIVKKSGGDITFVHTRQGWLYPAVIIDLATRKVVGWSMSERMKAGLVCDALTMAYELQ